MLIIRLFHWLMDIIRSINYFFYKIHCGDSFYSSRMYSELGISFLKIINQENK